MNRFKKYTAIIICIIICIYFIGRLYRENETPPTTDSAVSNEAQLRVHFVDVGQGDSCFIELPDNRTMLIDAGESRYGADVCDYISALGYSTIDYVIATHAHADHIGGLPTVFDDFDVMSCYGSHITSTSKTYQRFEQAVTNEGIELINPTAGEYIINEDNLKIEVLGPQNDKNYKDTNDSSIVICLSYYSSDFLFTADAGYGVLEDYEIKDIEVLKVSHHGSRTGTTKRLISMLLPEYSVISLGINNKYNHPHKQAMACLKDTQIYRTDISGTITALCDGNNINFTTEK